MTLTCDGELVSREEPTRRNLRFVYVKGNDFRDPMRVSRMPTVPYIP